MVSARDLMPLSILRSMMKAPGSLSRTQKAVAGVSGQSTRHRLISRQPCAVGYRARHQTPASWSPATKPAEHDDQEDDDTDGPGGRREDDGNDRQSDPHDPPFVDSSFRRGRRRCYGRMS
jgi:hypothetical protein